MLQDIEVGELCSAVILELAILEGVTPYAIKSRSMLRIINAARGLEDLRGLGDPETGVGLSANRPRYIILLCYQGKHCSLLTVTKTGELLVSDPLGQNYMKFRKYIYQIKGVLGCTQIINTHESQISLVPRLYTLVNISAIHQQLKMGVVPQKIKLHHKGPNTITQLMCIKRSIIAALPGRPMFTDAGDDDSDGLDGPAESTDSSSTTDDSGAGAIVLRSFCKDILGAILMESWAQIDRDAIANIPRALPADFGQGPVQTQMPCQLPGIEHSEYYLRRLGEDATEPERQRRLRDLLGYVFYHVQKVWASLCSQLYTKTQQRSRLQELLHSTSAHLEVSEVELGKLNTQRTKHLAELTDIETEKARLMQLKRGLLEEKQGLTHSIDTHHRAFYEGAMVICRTLSELNDQLPRIGADTAHLVLSPEFLVMRDKLYNAYRVILELYPEYRELVSSDQIQSIVLRISTLEGPDTERLRRKFYNIVHTAQIMLEHRQKEIDIKDNPGAAMREVSGMVSQIPQITDLAGRWALSHTREYIASLDSSLKDLCIYIQVSKIEGIETFEDRFQESISGSEYQQLNRERTEELRAIYTERHLQEYIDEMKDELSEDFLKWYNSMCSAYDATKLHHPDYRAQIEKEDLVYIARYVMAFEQDRSLRPLSSEYLRRIQARHFRLLRMGEVGLTDDIMLPAPTPLHTQDIAVSDLSSSEGAGLESYTGDSSQSVTSEDGIFRRFGVRSASPIGNTSHSILGIPTRSMSVTRTAPNARKQSIILLFFSAEVVAKKISRYSEVIDGPIGNTDTILEIISSLSAVDLSAPSMSEHRGQEMPPIRPPSKQIESFCIRYIREKELVPALEIESIILIKRLARAYGRLEEFRAQGVRDKREEYHQRDRRTTVEIDMQLQSIEEGLVLLESAKVAHRALVRAKQRAAEIAQVSLNQTSQRESALKERLVILKKEITKLNLQITKEEGAFSIKISAFDPNAPRYADTLQSNITHHIRRLENRSGKLENLKHDISQIMYSVLEFIGNFINGRIFDHAKQNKIIDRCAQNIASRIVCSENSSTIERIHEGMLSGIMRISLRESDMVRI